MSYYTIGSLFALTGTILVSFYSLKDVVRQKIIDQITTLNDLKNLGTPRPGERIKGTAVICGGSIAGLWAARVCADHFEDVLIVEPEEWLATEEGRTSRYDKDAKKRNDIQFKKRTRVMQYEQSHYYQPLSFSALKKLFPKAEEEFVQKSARVLPAWSDINFNGNLLLGTYPNHFPDGNYPKSIVASRACLETTLRRLIYQPGGRIRWLVGTVTGIKSFESNAKKIESVTVRAEDGIKSIPATLVIDCTGRSQMGMKLVERWQTETQPVTGLVPESLQIYRNVYTIGVTMASYRYVVTPEMKIRLPIPGGYDNSSLLYTWFGIAGERRSTFAINLEGNRIEISCVMLIGGSLPEGPEDLIDWLKNLRGDKPVASWFLETVTILQENDVDEILPTCKMPPCYWLHYENAKNLPDNFIATGDAVMFSNPRLVQGCTKACIDAVTLDRALRTVPMESAFSKQYFKLQSKRIGGIWNNNKQMDYGLPGTIPAEGETTDIGNFGRAVNRLILQLGMQGDEQVCFTLWTVRMFLAPGTDMLHPLILLKALFLKLRLILGLAKSMY